MLFDDVCDALLPSNANGKIVSVFSVYWDESYTHPEAKPPYVFVIGGYVAFKHHFNGFSERWVPIIEAAGLPCFHMSAYEARMPPYVAKHKHTFRLLTRVIREHAIQPFAFVTRFDGKMSKETFSRLYQKLIRLAIQTTVTTYGTKLDDGTLDGRDRFAFFLDRIPDPSVRQACRNWFDNKRDSEAWGKKLATLDFFKAAEYPPIQAADILAFDVMRHVRLGVDEAQRFSTKKLVEKRHIAVWEI